MAFGDTSIEFIPGIGSQKAALLKKELNLSTYSDLLHFYPFRYDDRTRIYATSEIKQILRTRDSTEALQLQLIVRGFQKIGTGRKNRLVAQAYDEQGEIELVWFQGIKWILDKLKPGVPYIFFGKASVFGRKINMAHPDFEPVTSRSSQMSQLQPVYSSTEALRKKYIDSKQIGGWIGHILRIGWNKLEENLTEELLQKLSLCKKAESFRFIHFPKNHQELAAARKRLKFEELFYLQLQVVKLKLDHKKNPGLIFNNSSLLTKFYHEALPFELTNAQKRVIKEIYYHMRTGEQMNRLLQGDVGSGKTITAFIIILIALSNETQATLMAPTEILADQHFKGLEPFAKKMGIRIAKLTGSTPVSERKIILTYLRQGLIDLLVGTHALLEDKVAFKRLGLAVIDEQHRFGVAQRAKLWQKNQDFFPHVLVMTATPIPRTLAMTVFGDLEISIIDELPAGRKAIITRHMTDSNRITLNKFLKDEIAKGRQVYIVYPLIDESEKLDLKHLMDGYESISRDFPNYHISIVHGKMKAADKDYEMQRFLKKETQIMVATTVIEVGVNVPNAAVMVIENAERFGLAQLHQLRGRVGRGADQSYCILMSSHKLTKEAKERIQTMVNTNNGFEIAEVDLRLRGPGDLTGTQQSGMLELSIANLTTDQEILKVARALAHDVLKEDPELNLPKNRPIKRVLDEKRRSFQVDLGKVG